MSSLQLHSSVTCLQSLPNELLLMMFRYLTTFDIYYAFYTMNSAFNSLIKNEQLNFDLIEQMPLDHAIFAVEQILPNLSEGKLKSIEITHNTVFWRFIDLNPSFSCIALHTINLKNLIKLPFAPVMSLLQQSSQLKHLRIQIESNGDSSWLDGTKWDTLIEYQCPNIETLYASISNLPSIQRNSNPKFNSITETFQSSRWKQGSYRIYYFSQANTGNLLITQSQILRNFK
jgi:hypothetical protein